MTGSWNEASGSGQADADPAGSPPVSPQAADDAWPSFEDALRMHGFDVAPPSLPKEEATLDGSDTPDGQPTTTGVDLRSEEPEAESAEAAQEPEPALTWLAEPETRSEPESEAEPEPEPVMDAAPAAMDDADAPVLPNVGPPAAAGGSVFGFVDEAAADPHVWGDTPQPASDADRWWLEPEAALEPVRLEPAAPEPVRLEPAAPEPAAASGWPPFDAAPESPRESATHAEPRTPTGDHRWPGETTWASGDAKSIPAEASVIPEGWPDEATWSSDTLAPSAEPALHDIVATVPQTLPDHRLPTPPPSLFARRRNAPTTTPAVDAGVPRPVREDVPSVAPSVPTARLAIAPEAFAPWEFEPPDSSGAPSAPDGTAAASPPIQSDGSDFWGESQAPETHPESPVVDDNWASPGFTSTGGAGAVPGHQPYAFGADARVPYEATPTPYDAGPGPSGAGEPSVDWYEAAALEVVGTSTPTDTSSTEFVGYDEPGEPEPVSEAAVAAHEATETEPSAASESGAEAEDASASAEMRTTPDDLLGDDPWASQAFLDRIPETPQDSVAMGLSHAETETETESEAETPSAQADRIEAAAGTASTELPDDAWPALATDAWPEATADGWPEQGAANAWSVAPPVEAGAAEEPTPAASPETAPETESWDGATPLPAETASIEHEVEPESWDAALAILAPSDGKTAGVEAPAAPEAAEPAEVAQAAEPAVATAEEVPWHDAESEPAAAATAAAAAVAGAEAHAAEAHAAVKTETGPFSRYAAEAEVHRPAASTAARAADSDLWQLVADPAASAAEPAAGQKRSFDPVSVFLTVLVAIVIVVLLVGFLIFAQSIH